jgi:succinate dehydrogenase hydrophobic membrane anchor protein
MNTDILKTNIEASLIHWLKKIPIISLYAGTRGWPYIISWSHRITGILLVISLWAYLFGFHTLQTRQKGIILSLFLWMLAIPMAFHGFNGARLILYEFFGNRNDEAMIRWVFALSFMYVAVLGMLMLMGNQTVSPFFYWVIMVVPALIVAYGVAASTLKSGHSVPWKMQRISGSFLLVMVPAYVLFIPLNPSPEIKGNFLVAGIQGLFLTAVYILLLLCALFHAGYGVWSIMNDYLSSRNLGKGLGALVTFISLIFAWIGLRAILCI